METATLQNISASPAPDPISVQFNPTEYGIDYGANYAEMQVPGLGTPLLQFVRGEQSTLTLELFLDSTDTRASLSSALGAPSIPNGVSAQSGANLSVEDRLAQIRTFVLIDRELHAPPVCQFTWNNVQFQGVVTSLREKYSLFDPSGNILRARVTLTLKQYASVEKQAAATPQRSPDHTRVRVVRAGDTITQIANEAYGDPRFWKLIASTNGIARPRFLVVGQALLIPAI